MPPRLMLALSALFILLNAGSAKRCEPVTIPMCKGIGYNMTAYPNSYGHEKQEEAGLEVHQFYPLVEVGCYQHLKFFLCALYTPICQDNYDNQILPCMELCLEAKKRCSPIMQRYGFRWPETLSCDALPRMSEQHATGNICAAPPDTPAKIVTSRKEIHRPGADIELPLPELQPEIGISTGDSCTCRCVPPFEKGPKSSFVGNVSHCSYPCRAPFITDSNQQFLTKWIAVWSTTCFVLSVFTVLTFLIETDRFQYPERPIFVLAFCQAMVAVGFLIRVWAGHEAIACESWRVKTGDSTSASLCFLVFLLIYFFGMAASVWWVVLSLTWVLAAASKWSSEAISSYSPHFHCFAWGLPLLQTGLAIVYNAVDGDPVSGICYVGSTDVSFLRNFVLAPLVVYFCVGVAFLFVGFFNLWRIRTEVQQRSGVNNASKLTQLMSKIGIFSVLYTVPALFVILVVFYEQRHRPLWEQSVTCSCSSSKPLSGDVSLLLSLIKTASMLIVGWTSGVWIASRKTMWSWADALCCTSSAHPKYQPADALYAKSDCSTPHFYSTTLRQQHLYKQPMLPEKL